MNPAKTELNTEGPSKKEIFRERFRHDSLFSFRSPKGFIPMLLHNYAEQAASPFHMNGRQAVYLAGWTGITVALFGADPSIDRQFRPLKERHPWIREISPQVTNLGDYYGYALVAALCGYGVLFREHKIMNTALLAGQAMVTAGTWSRVGKIMTGRMRPGATYGDAEYPDGHWFGPFAEFKEKYNRNRGIASFDAFPSGHTSTAFSIATVYAMRYRDHRAVPVISYSLAGIVAVTRLIEHDHWASDLIPGALAGYLCGRQVVRHYEKLFPEYQPKRKDRKTQSLLWINKNNGGFVATYTLRF